MRIQLPSANRILELSEVAVWARQEWDCAALCRHGVCTKEGVCVCDGDYMGGVCEANVLTDHVFLPTASWLVDDRVRRQCCFTCMSSVCVCMHAYM